MTFDPHATGWDMAVVVIDAREFSAGVIFSRGRVLSQPTRLRDLSRLTVDEFAAYCDDRGWKYRTLCEYSPGIAIAYRKRSGE